MFFYFESYSFVLNYLGCFVTCSVILALCAVINGTAQAEGWGAVPAPAACTWIYSCDLSTQEWVDKSLLTSEEALPLVICKCETAAIREERLCSTGPRNLFKGRRIWGEVLIKNVLVLPGS